MPLRILFITWFLFTIPAFAFEPVLSAERMPGQRWEDALSDSIARQGISAYADSALNELDSSVAEASAIPEWQHGRAALEKLFSLAKNTRLYPNPNSSRYRRKSAWLYINDGCYSRAAHVSYVASVHGYPPPGKVYAFGNLRFHSRYARNGSTAYWSYHVAAAYRIGAAIYVIDPSVSSRVIRKSQWLRRFSSHPSHVRVSLCDSHSYSPQSACRGGQDNGANLEEMGEFLRLEWSNLSRLGYSPNALLEP